MRSQLGSCCCTEGSAITGAGRSRRLPSPPPGCYADDGQIDAHLSGRSLLAVLVTTQHILDPPADDDPAAWSLDHAIHSRTQRAVTTASSRERSHNSEVTAIFLDDRPPAAD
ncbi:hypothetical protein AB0F77_36330 [Streptomyces sp. NPDC026672]|uniref:hypothetical protein n=1 Tax=unclassified Streptomyces TaxID=2593676 RepID=UPI0033CE81C3